MKALGMIETVGFSAALKILDDCLKAAEVKLINYEANFGQVIIKIEGDVAAVKAAVEAGENSVNSSAIISSHVICMPDKEVEGVIKGNKYMGDKYPPVNPENISQFKKEKP
ncbi:MAG: BMC domain-containing protein, partial [Candidatus Muiribacteriota bacterium]